MLVGVITMKNGKRWEQFQNTFKGVKYHIIEAMTPNNFFEIFTFHGYENYKNKYTVYSLLAGHIKAYQFGEKNAHEFMLVLEDDAYPLNINHWPYGLQEIAMEAKVLICFCPFTSWGEGTKRFSK
jgi:glycosidase